ncbi:PilZ domain-containing protein [Thermoproteota archaeon]
MSLHNHKSEKRRHPRIAKNLPIRIKDGDFDIVTETKNISCTGIYCQVDRYFPPFTKIKTKILLPAKTKNKHQYIECDGIVVRIEKDGNDLEEQYNIAIYFNEISKTSVQKISRFIKQRERVPSLI